MLLVLPNDLWLLVAQFMLDLSDRCALCIAVPQWWSAIRQLPQYKDILLSVAMRVATGALRINNALMRKYIWDKRMTEEGCEWLTAAAQKQGSPLAIMKKASPPKRMNVETNELKVVKEWFLTGVSQAYDLRQRDVAQHSSYTGTDEPVLVREQDVRLTTNPAGVVHSEVYHERFFVGDTARRQVRTVGEFSGVVDFRGKSRHEYQVRQVWPDGSLYLFEGGYFNEQPVYGWGPQFREVYGLQPSTRCLLDDNELPASLHYPDGRTTLVEAVRILPYTFPPWELRIMHEEWPDGTVQLFEAAAAPDFQRLVRQELPNGTVQLFEGGKGVERKVREELADGSVYLFEGEKGAERKVLERRPEGTVFFYEGEKGAERPMRKHHPDGCKFQLYATEGERAPGSFNARVFVEQLHEDDNLTLQQKKTLMDICQAYMTKTIDKTAFWQQLVELVGKPKVKETMNELKEGGGEAASSRKRKLAGSTQGMDINALARSLGVSTGQAQHPERLVYEFKHYLTQVVWDKRPDIQKILDKYQVSPMQHQRQICDQLKRKLEQFKTEQLWGRALKLLQCHRQQVPTLLGLCVVKVARMPATPIQETSELRIMPAGLHKYVIKVREWVREQAQIDQTKGVLRERESVLREHESALRERASALRARQSEARVRESALRKRANQGYA